MQHDDPFGGFRLSEQGAPAKIEQRLFTLEAKPPATPKAAVVPKPVTSESSDNPKPSPPSTKSNMAPSSKSQLPADSRFDLNDDALYKASYLFTQEELEALEDLKLELRREYDTKVTKNDLIRSALHMLLEDHFANGLRSYASRKIKKR